MRMAVVAISFVLITSSSSAAMTQSIQVGGKDGVEYLVPAGSPVKYVSKNDGELQANFHGRFTISGTYYYGTYYAGSMTEATDDDLDLDFIPDKKFAVTLPYWRDRGQVHEIEFRNKDAFINAAIPSSVVRDLKSRKIVSAHGKVSVVIEDYQASVECDAPAYSVTFVSVVHPPTLVLNHNSIEEYTC
ncbi:MAG TPA: hypothetical protein VN693_04445 [Rhodanobacteraceae bacterium]|nr:hypothetical protein [Rhodanobacteraceae bacterium]